MATVILASSLSLLREGMKGILSTENDIRVAGVFSCVKDLCARTKYHRDEIIVFADPVFDLNEETLREISVRFPPLKTIMIARTKTMRPRLEELGEGTRGMLAAECTASCLPDAIRTVNSGKAYVSVELLDLFFQPAQLKSFSAAYESLSERELEIFARIAAGKRNCAISSELDISSKTVCTHKARIMEKLGVRSVPELVQYALRTGLIDKWSGVEANEVFSQAHQARSTHGPPGRLAVGEHRIGRVANRPLS
jgi:DNA-binding NarL/FixJ family response regulator